jgi:hypothetical protein
MSRKNVPASNKHNTDNIHPELEEWYRNAMNNIVGDQLSGDDTEKQGQEITALVRAYAYMQKHMDKSNNKIDKAYIDKLYKEAQKFVANTPDKQPLQVHVPTSPAQKAQKNAEETMTSIKLEEWKAKKEAIIALTDDHSGFMPDVNENNDQRRADLYRIYEKMKKMPACNEKKSYKEFDIIYKHVTAMEELTSKTKPKF